MTGAYTLKAIEAAMKSSELACKYSDLVDKKMTTSEVPGYKIAVGALEQIKSAAQTAPYMPAGNVAREALSRIKELGGLKDGC